MLRNTLDANSRCRPMRRLRRVVSNVGRKPGFGATPIGRLRLSRTAGEMSPAPPLFGLAPRLGSLGTSGVSRVPAVSKEEPRGSRLAVQLDQAPIGVDVAHRALRGVCPGIAITAMRHCYALRRPRRLQPTTLLSQPVDAATIAARHEDRTRNLLSKVLAASGLEADFAACHYPFPPVATVSHRRCTEVVTGGTRGTNRRGPSVSISTENCALWSEPLKLDTRVLRFRPLAGHVEPQSPPG